MTGEWRLSCGDALDFYDTWDTPTTIISDGAYGVGGFPGDPRTPTDLPRWYEPHIAAWSAKATLATTLWLHRKVTPYQGYSHIIDGPVMIAREFQKSESMLVAAHFPADRT